MRDERISLVFFAFDVDFGNVLLGKGFLRRRKYGRSRFYSACWEGRITSDVITLSGFEVIDFNEIVMVNYGCYIRELG